MTKPDALVVLAPADAICPHGRLIVSDHIQDILDCGAPVAVEGDDVDCGGAPSARNGPISPEDQKSAEPVLPLDTVDIHRKLCPTSIPSNMSLGRMQGGSMLL